MVCIIRNMMKRLIALCTMIVALSVVPLARAETVSCSTSQYGGAVCGVSTTTETVVEHKVVNTGTGNELAMIIAGLSVTALVAAILYKLTYRSYIFG